MTTWLNAVNSAASTGLKVAAIAGFSAVPALYQRGLAWMKQHTSKSERALLHQIGDEAVGYAERFLSALPEESRVEEAVRYARGVLQGLGLTFPEQEVMGAVASKLNGVNRNATKG